MNKTTDSFTNLCLRRLPLLLGLLASFLAGCSGGLGKSIAEVDASTKRLPSITTLSPASTAAGTASFKLTVKGTGFVAGSTVDWGGAALPTTYVSTGQLTAQVAASYVANAGSVAVTVANPTSGGGISNAAKFTITVAKNAPVVSSLAPATAAAGSGAFALTVNGSGFASTSVVNWNGTPLPTTYTSSTLLTAQVPASDLVAAGTAGITVSGASGTSNSATFTITTANPAPALSSLSPASAAAGSGTFTLTINGSGFIATSVVDWNGAPLPTTYASSTQLTAQVPATDVATAGTATITVANPTPGGGTSGAAVFTITSAGTTSGPSLVQYATYQTNGLNTEINSTVQFASATAPGNTIWVAVTVSDYGGIHQISVTDTQGNTYIKLDQKDDLSPGWQSVAHFYASNIAGDASSPNIVTINWPFDDYKGVLVTEISGVSAAPLAGHSANIQDALAAGTNNVTSGSINVAAGSAPALLVALSMNTSGGSSNLGGSTYGGPAAGSAMTQRTQCWNWGANLATFATQIVPAGSTAAAFNAPDTDDYVTVAAAFH